MEKKYKCRICEVDLILNDNWTEARKKHSEYICKKCHVLKYQEYREQNKEKVKQYEKEYREKNKERIKQKKKEYREKNKERIKEKKKEYWAKYSIKYREYREKNKERIKQRKKEYYEKNKEKILKKLAKKTIQNKKERKCLICSNIIPLDARKDKIYCSIKCSSKANRDRNRKNWKETIRKYEKKRKRKKYHNDELYNLKARCRARVTQYFRYKPHSKNKKTIDYIGADWETVKKHIEKQFKENMTWENRHLWHIDHIIPLATAKNKKEVYKLTHYTNLQPLWAEENIKKSDKIL